MRLWKITIPIILCLHLMIHRVVASQRDSYDEEFEHDTGDIDEELLEEEYSAMGDIAKMFFRAPKMLWSESLEGEKSKILHYY